jgi:hypothetical protein
MKRENTNEFLNRKALVYNANVCPISPINIEMNSLLVEGLGLWTIFCINPNNNNNIDNAFSSIKMPQTYFLFSSYHLLARAKACAGDYRSALQSEKSAFNVYQKKVFRHYVKKKPLYK